jgi:hypothetical protein
MKKSHSDRRWSDAPVAQAERTCVDMLADAPGLLKGEHVWELKTTA